MIKIPQKEEKPLVSIALASFNGAAFIAEQLQSLVSQSYSNIEIIISDDNSTDATISIVNDFQKKYSNIYFYKNAGSSGIKQNFENALTFCKGEYIALCDQDDVWKMEKIERLVSEIGNNDLTYHDSLFIDDNGNTLHQKISDKMNCYSGNDGRVFLMYNVVSGHACLFNRRLLNKALPFPYARYHDWWLAFVAAENGGVKYIDEVLVHYRQHEKSKTDILALKKHSMHIKEYTVYSKEMEWYNSCAAAAKINTVFFNNWALLYAKRKNQWLCPALFLLARRNRKSLYFLRKKNNISIYFESLKLLWGIKLKRILN